MAARAAGKKIIIVKKKGGGGGGHHGGSWKVAYADFVTAMMAFFMVMWILGMDEKTKQAIEGYFSNPVGYKKGYGAGASPLSNGNTPSAAQRTPLRMLVRSSETRTFEALKEHIQDKMAASDSLKKLNGMVDIHLTKEGLRIELVETGVSDVFFQSGSARMMPATMLVLQLIGRELASMTQQLVLEGHTDAAKFGADASYGNWELSADRANAARRVLLGAGLKEGRILEVRGYAATKLRVPDNPLASSNRRTSILLPFSDPPDGDGTAEALAAAKTEALTTPVARPLSAATPKEH